MLLTTKAGDRGRSTYFRGGRAVGADKDDGVFEVLGEVDELAAVLAIAGKQTGEEKRSARMTDCLVKIGGYVGGGQKETGLNAEIEFMEEEIKKKSGGTGGFLRPGEEMDEWWNWVRTVARRLERRMVSLSKKTDIDKEILVYLNRLSDYLFIISQESKS